MQARAGNGRPDFQRGRDCWSDAPIARGARLRLASGGKKRRARLQPCKASTTIPSLHLPGTTKPSSADGTATEMRRVRSEGCFFDPSGPRSPGLRGLQKRRLKSQSGVFVGPPACPAGAVSRVSPSGRPGSVPPLFLGFRLAKRKRCRRRIEPARSAESTSVKIHNRETWLDRGSPPVRLP